MSMRVGFFGLGIMGVPMSLNTAKAGITVTGYNRSSGDFSALQDAGVSIASSAADCAASSDVLVLMLTGPEACDAVLFGPDGVGDNLSGKTVINMSTVSPGYTEELAGKLSGMDVRFVDAPVSGSKKPAEEGNLVILAGGERSVVDEMEPLFLAMGKKVVFCGPAGKGSMMKMAINMMLGVVMESLNEMMEFGVKGGLDKETMLEVAMSGAVACPLLGIKKDMMLNAEFPPQFPLKHMAKDMRFIMDIADANDVKVPAARVVADMLEQGMDAGWGDDDFAATYRLIVPE